MLLDLTTTSNAVHIINLSTDHTLYWIRKEELARKRDGNLSEWIMHLMAKRWIDKDMLYQLASEIKRQCPNNSIDWEATFFEVEKHYYMEKAFQSLDEADNPVEKFYKRVHYGRQLSNETTDQRIQELVASQQLR